MTWREIGTGILNYCIFVVVNYSQKVVNSSQEIYLFQPMSMLKRVIGHCKVIDRTLK